MSAITWTERRELSSSAADKALQAATRFWFVVTIVGQWAFLYYITAFYGSSTLQGNFQAWTKNKLLIKGYVPGDTAGNLMFAAHALFAAVIAFGGMVQLIPQIRARAPWIHRWNGRLFLFTSIGVSLSGLYMVWVRGARLSMSGATAVSINGLLILIFSVLAWRTAMTRDFTAHRRWALRAFIVANGQWFIRIGMVAWMIVSQGQDRGFFRIWNFGCYLLPLAVVELYVRVKEKGSPGGRFAMAGGLFVLTLLMGFGIAGLSAFLWKQILSRL